MSIISYLKNKNICIKIVFIELICFSNMILIFSQTVITFYLFILYIVYIYISNLILKTV